MVFSGLEALKYTVKNSLLFTSFFSSLKANGARKFKAMAIHLVHRPASTRVLSKVNESAISAFKG